jgi:hypothetical protein
MNECMSECEIVGERVGSEWVRVWLTKRMNMSVGKWVDG